MIPQSVSMPIAYENPLNLDVVGSALSVLKSSSVVVDSFPGDVLEPKVVIVVVFESVVSLDATVVVDMIVMLVLALVLVAVPVVVGFVTAVV